VERKEVGQLGEVAREAVHVWVQVSLSLSSSFSLLRLLSPTFSLSLLSLSLFLYILVEYSMSPGRPLFLRLNTGEWAYNEEPLSESEA
jgi:hypothetical protein